MEEIEREMRSVLAKMEAIHSQKETEDQEFEQRAAVASTSEGEQTSQDQAPAPQQPWDDETAIQAFKVGDASDTGES